jgi:DNA polymerase-3 subunit gamma/tau
MTSQVFYRKWRPQTLSEVVGQQHVTQTLRNAVDSGRIAHAYLFCGPRGTGKTSTGRIMAKAVNCLKPVKGEPCNECQICLAVNEGSALDIIEIDAASNRGIDEIRDLKEKVNFSPNQAHYKVYIIDEVHMITKEAANAFLKTLEEPPKHVIFILATTEPHKVLATVLSRCQRFDFRRLSQAAVITKLEYVCKKEEIKLDPESLRLIAKATTGSLRDAENVLEQLVAYYGHNIELHQVQAMLGISSDLRTKELAQHIVDKDIAAGLNTINNISNDGVDLRQFNRDLVNCLRDLLLVKSGSENVVDATSEDLADLKSIAGNVSLDYLLTAVRQFGDIDIRLDSYSPLPLELALVETILSAASLKQPSPLEQVDTIKPTTEKPAMHPHPTARTAKPRDEEKQAALKTADSPPKLASKESNTTDTPDATVIAKNADLTATLENPTSNSNAGADGSITSIRSQWKEFINALRGTGSKGNLDAMLRSACEPVSLEDNVLTLGFYATFHKEYIEDQKYKFLVEKKLLEFFGQPYKIHCILTKQNKEAPKSPEMDSPALKAALKRGARLIN